MNTQAIVRGLAVFCLAAGLGDTGVFGQSCTDFDPPAPGAPWGCCGVGFTYDGIDFITDSFRDVGGVDHFGGFAEPWNACNGAGGHSLNVNNVNVRVDVPDFFGTEGVGRVEYWYMDSGGSVNLGINGHREWVFDNFHNIPANSYHPVGAHLTVTAAWTGTAWVGTVTIDALPGECIRNVSIGGQELCLDDLCGFGPCCQGDLNGDGAVNVQDLLAVLGGFGPCGGGACPADLNGDGVVNVLDLLIVLGNWGPC